MKKIISMLLVLAMMITVLTVGIATTNAAETATITIYGLDGTTEVKEFNVGDEFTVYTTLNVSSSVANGKIASVQGTQTYTSGVLSLVDEISGQYGEFADPVKVFPVTGDVTVANAAQDGKIVYNASDPAADGGFVFDSESSQLIVTTYKVKAAGSGEVKNVVKNLAAADSDLTRIIFEGQVQEGKSVAGKATFTDPTPAIDHAEVRVHSLNGGVETMSFNIGDTFNVYTTLDASSVNSGKMASINGVQRYTSTVLQLADTVDADGYITDTDKVFPIMKDGAIGSAKDAGSVKFVGSSTSGFEFNDAKDQLIVTTYRVTANGYADITNKLNILAAADEDITRLVFNGEIQNGASFLMPASFSTDGPVPTLPPQPPTQAPTQKPTTAPTQPSTQPATQPASKLNVTIINPDNTKAEKSFNVGDTFTVYTVLNAGATIASVDGTQTYPTSQLQLTDQVTGEYHEIVNTAAMFPILGDEAVASVNDGSLQFNASRGTIGGGFAFNTDTSKLIVTNYKVLATGDATIKTTLKALIKDDAAATKIVYNGATQSGQSYSMAGTFTDPGSVTPTQPATQAPTQPATQAPTQPATQPQNKAVVTIYGIDGTSSTKTFDIGAEFTVYTTLDGSQLDGIHGFASISASQTFTDSILKSTDEVDELDAVIDTTTMFPIIGSNAVAHIADGENKYNSSTSGVNRGFVFANEDALLAVTHYKVIAAGTAEIRNSISYLAADNSALTRIVNKGVLQPGYTLGGYASFYEPGTEPPTEPATQAPTEPATQAPTQPPTQKPTEAPTQPPTQPQSKATVTIYGIDGTSEVKTYNVGDTFTVYTTFDASSAAANGMIASINATQSFTKSILQSTDSVDSEGIVDDVNAMFPILGSKAIARIYDGVNQYNASTPTIGNGFKFDRDKALLIVTNYKVIASGNAEVRNALITVGAADENLTRIVNNGVVAEGKVIGGKATFTKPDEPTQPDTPTQPSTEPAEGYVLGDADNDGLVTSMDVTIIQRLRAKMTVSVPVEIIERNGDVDGDGVLTVMDATFIQRKLAKMTVEYPIGEYITI